MIAGIELGKEYVQICVKTEAMQEPESVTKIVGTENYRIPIEADLKDQAQLQELFRRIWKMLAPYGSKESVEKLVFCLEDNSKEMREQLLDIMTIYNIPVENVCFMEKEECFASYVLHQSGELLSHNSLLIENKAGELSKYILHKRARTMPVVTEVRDISEKTLEDVFGDHAISSVFLVGDDFEEAWLQQNLKLLKNGKRIFAGKNLYVKGAGFLGMDLKEETKDWIYLGAGKIGCNIALKVDNGGREEYVSIVDGGKNWYESNVALEVLLLEEPLLEFAMIPINGKEMKTAVIHLDHLPKRPKRTTRLRIALDFIDAVSAKLTVKDLGFGELFPQSDMVYEGELQWEQ